MNILSIPKQLCVTCRTCGSKPEITWRGDGYGTICQCDHISMMPWNAHPDQAMRSWNRCYINGNWSVTSQRESRDDIAGKRATYIKNMTTPLSELYEGGKA